MSKFCTNCGNPADDNATSCASCGSAFPTANATEQTQGPVGQNTNNFNSTPNVGLPSIEKKSIVTMILLSIITCGIYGIIWFVNMTDESNRASGSDAASGGTAILYTILTCGIYSFYWNYKMGQKMAEAGKRYGIDIEDRAVLYLVLSLLGLGIVNTCLIQSDLNRLAK